jgi:acetyl-CoA acetyltransferase family protein
MARALLLDAARTPFGHYRGGFAGVRVDDLAALPIAELLRRHGPAGSGRLDPDRIDDVIYGNTNGAGEENSDVARMAALLAGLPVTVPGVTVNRLAASGAEALVQAARAVRADDANLVIAGGVEGISRAPFVIPKSDEALADRLDAVPTTVEWRLVNPRMPPEWTIPLGRAADRAAQTLGITRAELDAYALRSHRRAAAAWDAGLHDGFVFPVTAPNGATVRRDESIRPNASEEKLAAQAPAYSADGPVTKGNSAPSGDGALAALVGQEEHAEQLGIEPLGELLGSVTAASDPDRVAAAPVSAIQRLLTRLRVSTAEIHLWEIHEAFAVTVLSVLRHLPDVDRELVNVHGGAIAYGDPPGASMPRTAVDLCRHLRHRGGGLGVAVAGVGVGQGTAIAVRA